jgi:hypothetical protein
MLQLTVLLGAAVLDDATAAIASEPRIALTAAKRDALAAALVTSSVFSDGLSDIVELND